MKRIFKNIIGLIIVILALGSVQMLSNHLVNKRLNEYNISILASITNNNANVSNVTLNEAKLNITSLAKELSTQNKKRITKEELTTLKNKSSFPVISFINDIEELVYDGKSFSGDDNLYQKVLNNESGIGYYSSNKFDTNNKIYVYSPVTYNTTQVGALVGYFSDSFFHSLLNAPYYGYQSNTFIINNNGDILASGNDINFTNLDPLFQGKKATYEVVEVSDRPTKWIISYTDTYGKTNAYCSRIGDTDCIFFKEFPSEAAKEIQKNINSFKLLFFFFYVLILIIFISYYMHIYIKERKELANVKQILNEKIKLEDQLEYNANHDQLTGVYNRFGYYQLLKTLNENDEYIYAVLDIDKFKEINDVYGHFEGDNALVNLMHYLSKEFTDSYIIRLGGDEFILISKNIIEIEEIQNRFASLNKKLENLPIGFTISVGVLIINYLYAELYREADKELYNSKNTNGISIKDIRK